MVDYKVTDTELTSIANAIRTKGGTQAQLEFPTGFVSAVQAIPTGGGGVVQPLSVTHNGIYNPPSGVDGYAPVTVNVSGGGGATILSGEEEPTSAIGSNGDIYLQTTRLLQPLVESQSELSVIVTANSNWGGYDPWKAFSSVQSDWWIGSGGNPHWLQVEFPSQQTLQEVSFITYDANRTHPISRIAYSNNNVDFTDAVLSESTTDGLSGHASVNGDCVGKYFRLIFDGSYGSSTYPGIGKLEMLGDGTNISKSYCKVNGIWQNLIGTNINDVNT